MKRTMYKDGSSSYTLHGGKRVGFRPTPEPIFPVDTCFNTGCGKPAAVISIIDGGAAYSVMCADCKAEFDNLPEFPVEPDRICFEPYTRDRAQEVFAAIQASFKR